MIILYDDFPGMGHMPIGSCTINVPIGERVKFLILNDKNEIIMVTSDDFAC